MKCRWYAEFEGVCTNGECPYRGDTCPTSEHQEVCKHAEEKKPKRIGVKDRLLDKKIIAHACIDKGQYKTEVISCVSYYNDGITFEGYSLDTMLLSELPKEDER